MRVNHIIVSLETGGAETMLIKLIENSPTSIIHEVITFRPHSQRALKLIEQGFIVKKIRFWQLLKIIKKEQPNILMGWLFHGTFLSAIIKLILGNKIKVIWNIRYSGFPKSNLRNLLIVKILKILSQKVDGIIYNSFAGKMLHEDLGYNSKNSIVIYNGYDLNLFFPNYESKIKFKIDHQLPKNSFIFGMVGRFDKLKNQIQFINFAQEFLRSIREDDRKIYFVFVGTNMVKTNRELSEQFINNKFTDRFVFLGEKKELNNIYPSFNVHCLYSITEGFPNVIGEAMACEVPCIASDVGDVKRIIGDTGWVVALGDKKQFIFALTQAYHADTEALKDLGHRARQKINEHYTLKNVINQYTLFLESQ